jgi:ATP-dependent RNA helicase DeaD
VTLPAEIDTRIAAALDKKGYAELTPVQEQMVAASPNRDLLVSAQTGSGKTVAFGLAMAHDLLGAGGNLPQPGAPLALVIAPTRELAMQVARELSWLFAGAGAVIATAVGGMDIRTERRALERGCHILVGTPGRLCDHVRKAALDLSAIKVAVLDEADEMLDLGFSEDLEFLLGLAPRERRTLMFSATVPNSIAELAATYQRDALRVSVKSAEGQHADIDYQVVLVPNHEREHAIINMLLLHDNANAMVFCHTREAVKHLAARLLNRGFPAVVISGELSQAERSSALQAMRDGRARICVATDVAARGIDLPSLDLVIHADVPSNPETLLHRSGRTGRAGRKGVCALIVPTHRRAAAQRVLKLANLSFTSRQAPTMAELDRHAATRMLEQLAELPAPAEGNEAELVARVLEKVTAAQLAALWVKRELADRPAPEEVSEEHIPPLGERPARKGSFDRPDFAERGERPERVQLENSVWFTLSIGRTKRADPKWLLPLICKAGDINRKDVGSIKIMTHETRFELSTEAAVQFNQALKSKRGEIENGIIATEMPGKPPKREWTDRAPRPEGGAPAADAGKPWKKKAEGKPFEGKPYEGKPYEGKPYAKKPFGKPGFEKPAQERPAQERPAHEKRAYDKGGAGKDGGKPFGKPFKPRTEAGAGAPADTKPAKKTYKSKPRRPD